MFECPICKKSFRANANLNRHLKDIHHTQPHFVQDDDPTLYDFIFYMIRNKENGKRYVGATTQSSVKKRWRNGKGYKFNPEFTADIEKYGVDNFELIELERVHCTVYVAKRLEEKYMDSLTPEYNKNHCGIKIISPKMTEAAKEKLSSIPNWYKDRVAPCVEWQKAHPEEARQIVAKNGLKGAAKVSKPVICVDTQTTYPSATQAAKQLGICQSKITACCQGKIASYLGQEWRYADNLGDIQ